MREESHLDDMRSAIRGDFERLAARRGGQDLLKSPEQAVEPETPPPEEAAPEAAHPLEPEPVTDPEHEAVSEPAEAESPEMMDKPELEAVSEEGAETVSELTEDPPPEELPRRSLLDRLLGR